MASPPRPIWAPPNDASAAELRLWFRNPSYTLHHRISMCASEEEGHLSEPLCTYAQAACEKQESRSRQHRIQGTPVARVVALHRFIAERGSTRKSPTIFRRPPPLTNVCQSQGSLLPSHPTAI